jgi:hypothetical protein
MYTYISFKEFSAWCNRRAADGKWGMSNAIECSQLCSDMYKVFFLKREKVWKEKHEAKMRELVNEVERLIELERQNKLKEELDKKAAYKKQCYEETRKSRYNQPEFRQLNNPSLYMGMPFIVKPEAKFTGKNLANETSLQYSHSNRLGDYMSFDYDKCSLGESLIYNDYLHKFVYTIDIFPTNSDIYDPLLVLTADKISEFDGDSIDKFIIDILEESFLEYDKKEIQNMIEANNDVIEPFNKKNNFLKQWIK